MEAREFGGPAKNLVETVKRLPRHVEVLVVTFIRGRHESSEFTRTLAEHGVSFHVIREGFRYDPRAITALRRIAQEYDPAILQVHNGKSRLYLHVLKTIGFLRGAVTIDCYHGETWTDRKQLIYNKIDRWLFRRASHVIVVSRRQQELLTSFGVPRDRIHVIYNGIPSRRSSPKTPRSEFNILSVGRLSQEKGHEQLLQAAGILRDRGAGGLRIDVVGDGPEMQTLLEQSSAMGLDNVHFEGYQSDPAAYYDGADLFVLPSLSEGLPNVLLEAAMYDLPIVSTAVGGVPEMFVHEEEALLVSPGDAEALAASIERCLHDSALCGALAAGARRRVETQFTQDRRAEEFLRYYEALVGRSSE